MSFELPNLDRKNWQQLVAEMLRMIPQYTRQWTDYNDSDPGITLLQMLAWLDEALLYQANAIPVQSDENYLRWVLGLAFPSNSTAYSKAAVSNHDYDFLALQQLLGVMLAAPANAMPAPGSTVNANERLGRAQIKKAVLEYVQAPYLALTLANVELLAMQTNLVIAEQAAQAKNQPTPLYVARAYALMIAQASAVYILSDAKALYQYPNYPNKSQYSGNANVMRKLVMLKVQDDTDAEKTLLRQVQSYLTPRVLAGNQVIAKPAQRTDINVTLDFVGAPNTSIAITLTQVFAALFHYFLPLLGGPEGQGWQYNSAPQNSDIEQLIWRVPGIAEIRRFACNYIPTMQLDRMATLDVDAQLADLPAGTPAMRYVGLPRLRCLDVIARSSA
jgi:hypothetical protein